MTRHGCLLHNYHRGISNGPISMPDGGAMLHVNFNVAMSIQLPQQSS